jgi:hypothetical protein
MTPRAWLRALRELCAWVADVQRWPYECTPGVPCCICWTTPGVAVCARSFDVHFLSRGVWGEYPTPCRYGVRLDFARGPLYVQNRPEHATCADDWWDVSPGWTKCKE